MNDKEIKLIKKITDKIRDNATRWEGLVELKNIQLKSIDSLIYYCDDSFWLVRWAVIEKIGDMQPNDIQFLFNKLLDNDFHVKKNTKKRKKNANKCESIQVS